MEEPTNVVIPGSTPEPAIPGEPPAPPVEPGEPGTPTPPPEPPEPKGSEPSRAEKRIKQLVAEREYFRGLAEGRQAHPAAPVVETVPVPENFDNYDDYLIAKAKHEIKRDYIAEQQKAKVLEAQRTFIQKIEAEPDVMEILSDQTLPVSDAMAAAIRESDIAPQVLRFLNDNRQEAARIFRMPPFIAAKEIGKIESKILNTPPPAPIKKVSQAPEPIKTVGGTNGIIEIDPDKMSTEDFIAKRNKESPPGRRR